MQKIHRFGGTPHALRRTKSSPGMRAARRNFAQIASGGAPVQRRCDRP